MNILGKSTVTYEQCEAWVKSVKTANPLLLENLPLIWKSAVANGLLPEIMLSQVCIETGYFNFGGVLNASYHNTCGLKVTKGGGDKDANAHMKFKTWEEGIQAHADHLALYAGAPKFPKYSPNCASHPNEQYKANGTTQDPRHFTYLYGCCKTVEGLSGTWATNKDYANSIKKLVNQIKNTKVSSTVTGNLNPKINTKAEVAKNTINFVNDSVLNNLVKGLNNILKK